VDGRLRISDCSSIDGAVHFLSDRTWHLKRINFLLNQGTQAGV
jgi:hypothetical protein